MQVTPELVAKTFVSVQHIIVSRHERALASIKQRVGIGDLLQNVISKALRFCSSCRAETPDELQHWILTIAKNTAYSMLRDNQSSPIRSTRREEVAVGVESQNSRDGYQPADLESDPSALAEMAESTAAMLAVLDRLSPSQSAAVRMRYLEQVDYAVIASQLNTNYDGARLLVSRGLARARKLLTDTASVR